MTGAVVRLWLMMPLVYLAAFASGIRPARWFGSRLLPLVTVVLPAFVLQFALLGPLGPLIGLPAIFVLTAVMISNILLEAETRDF